MIPGHVFIAMSLDGFVARLDDGLDWLMKQQIEGEDHGYDAFYKEVDGTVMGSNSFKTVLTLGDWHYTKPVVIMSRSLTRADIPESLRDKVAVTADTPEGVMGQLEGLGWRSVYVDGGEIVQSFLRAGLIQEMTVTVIPILLGAGKRLFGPLQQDIDLTLRDATSYPSGLVRLRYKVG